MYLFTVEGIASTASFRIPESHTFQQTLPLPPITTLIGLVGAALGLGFEDAMRFREDNGLYLGVIGKHNGQFRDLWKYHKIKTGKVISDVLLREYLVDFRMKVAIGSEDTKVVAQVREGFLNPCYALTAGNSDDLLKICEVGQVKDIKGSLYSEFQNTVLLGDHTGVYEPILDLKNTPITETICAPQVFLLPTAFSFIGNERRVTRKEHFTFVGSPIRLKELIPAFWIAEDTMALL